MQVVIRHLQVIFRWAFSRWVAHNRVPEFTGASVRTPRAVAAGVAAVLCFAIRDG